MNKKIMPIFVIFGLIVILLIGGVTALFIRFKSPGREQMDAGEYYGLEQEDEVALILNDEILKSRGKNIDGELYMDYDTVSSSVNSRCYWDEKQQKLIFTTPEEILYLTADAEDILTESGAPVFRKIGDVCYIAVEFLRQHTDMDSEVYENPARVVMRNRWNHLRIAEVKKDTKLRLKGGIKSRILTELEETDTVFVLEELDNWTKVSTWDGYIGYIEKKHLGEPEELPVRAADVRYEFSHITVENKINLAFHQVTSQAGNDRLAEVLAGIEGVTVLSPTWFYVKDSDGTVNTLADPAYVQTAHEAGISVWGLFSNLEAEVDMLALLSDSDRRAFMIEQVLAEAKRTGLDGINLDFENLNEALIPHYIQFQREFTMEAHKQGLIVSADTAVPMPFNRYHNLREQGAIVDYIVVMGYDEHYAGSEKPGSVSSISFVEKGITGTLENVPAERVVQAIPFYTRIWIEEAGGGLRSEVLGMNGADEYIEGSHMEKSWDEKTGQYVASVENKNGTYTIWLEEERSIEEKMKLIQQYKLAGVAEWKLGFERQSVWEVIDRYLE